jgi:xanthine/uracil permease
MLFSSPLTLSTLLAVILNQFFRRAGGSGDIKQDNESGHL